MTLAPWAAAKRTPRAMTAASPSPRSSRTLTGMIARAVGQAGEPDAVVGGLGDRRGDVGAVAVAVVGEGVVADEVVAGDEARAGEVGRSAGVLPNCR